MRRHLVLPSLRREPARRRHGSTAEPYALLEGDDDAEQDNALAELDREKDGELHMQQQKQPPPPPLNAGETAAFICTLWPYMVPLVVVYATEYAMQSGTCKCHRP